MQNEQRKPINILLGIQCLYFLATALWALVDVNSFMMVTGPKTDIWLVKTVAALIFCIGLSMGASLLAKELPIAVIVLCLSSALMFLIIDAYYAFKGTISAVYLADAVVELCFVIGWTVYLFKSRSLSAAETA